MYDTVVLQNSVFNKSACFADVLNSTLTRKKVGRSLCQLNSKDTVFILFLISPVGVSCGASYKCTHLLPQNFLFFCQHAGNFLL